MPGMSEKTQKTEAFYDFYFTCPQMSAQHTVATSKTLSIFLQRRDGKVNDTLNCVTVTLGRALKTAHAPEGGLSVVHTRVRIAVVRYKDTL